MGSSCGIGGTVLRSHGVFSYISGRFMSSKIFIGGIPSWIDDPVLKEAFSGFGDVEQAAVVRDVETGQPKGFGFVSFYDADSAETAINGMDGQIVANRTLRVRPATPRSR